MGYKLLKHSPGVYLYRNGAIYIQKIHLDQGAKLSFAHGGMPKPGRFKFHQLRVYWRYLKSVWYGDDLFSVVNGAFWKVGENPARLALPLKIHGVIYSRGFDSTSYINRDKALLFQLRDDNAEIIDFVHPDQLDYLTAHSIIGGLNWQARRRVMEYTGRTIIATGDEGRTVYILSTRQARQNQANKILKDDFGADRIMMLDGGGSSQMICRGTGYVITGRALPQVIGVVSGEK